MRNSVYLLLAALLSFGTPTNATELLLNGGFEQPSTDGLFQVFHLNQQQIPGWQFADGDVVLVNHTRLMAGEGFQSLLLPFKANKSSTLRQEFAVKSDGPIRISFELVASKAVDGNVEVVLDDKTIKNIRLSDFWKPEEIALTDQMKWLAFKLPNIQAASGSHVIEFRVPNFQPRPDRQGDKRASIQGILIDAVSVEDGAESPTATVTAERPWPTEKVATYDSSGILPLDALAGPWDSTRTLACYPSLSNFYGSLGSTKEMGGIQYLHFTGIGRATGVINALSLDGEPVFCDQTRWYPYQLKTRAQMGPLDIEATTRMVFADNGALTRFSFVNSSDQPVTRTVEMVVPGGGNQPNPSSLLCPKSPHLAYQFTVTPDQIMTTDGVPRARWKLSLAPHSTEEISVAMALDPSPAAALEKAQRWGGDFANSFAAAKSGWQRRWHDVFTPGNGTYSGFMPTLETDDQKLRELYYLSIVSLLQVERDNFPLFKQSFVGEDPEWGGDITWFWDISLTSLPYALLNPAQMKVELRQWLNIDWLRCSHFSVGNGKPGGRWYAVNPYAYFLTIDRYLTVTGDYGFLSETVNGKTVLDHLETLAMDWKRLVPKDGKLADFGGHSWDMLEAPPNYVHTVASLNAANIWMMRRLAEYQTRCGNSERAAQLRAAADALVPEVLKLYHPATGSWDVEFPGGKRIDSRHVYDYLTVGTTISDDLSPTMKTGMMNFVDQELMTKTWMRAMSRQDPSAFDSDRSDHGPAGSYTGWPAKTGQATAELGRFDTALDMYHRFRGAFDSAIPQAIELTKVAGQDDLQARVSTRAGASFAEVSGSFAEVIINTFFGFRPNPEGTTPLWNPQVPRGFNGQLRHVRWNGSVYTIVSDKAGLHVERE